MCKICRPGVLMIVTTMVLCALQAGPSFAQRIVIGGGASQSNQNRNNDDDDDDDDEERDNKNNNQGRRSSRSGSRTSDQINQFLQGAQGGQGGRAGQGGQNGQPGANGQDGQGGRGGQGGQGGQGGDDDLYFNNPGQSRSSNQPRRFPENQFELQRRFRPDDDAQNLRFGNWQGERWQGSRSVKQWSQVFAGNKQPFSSQWYKEHPKAWRHEHHDHDDIWVVATLPGVYSWLGWGNAPGVRIGNQSQVDLSRFHDFYPLGVYSLMSGPGDMGTRVVQLAIDRHGHIAGNYYDLITDTNSSVAGEVRRDSQSVYWSVNKNKAIRFRASLNRLVQPYGVMTAQLPGGEQDWQFVRLED